MLFPDRAIDELNRASKLPGMRGVYMGTNINHRDLDDPLFEPIFTRIEALNLPISCIRCRWLADSAPRRSISLHAELPFRHAIAVCHLIFGACSTGTEASVQPAARRGRVADADGTHRPRRDSAARNRKA